VESRKWRAPGVYSAQKSKERKACPEIHRRTRGAQGEIRIYGFAKYGAGSTVLLVGDVANVARFGVCATVHDLSETALLTLEACLRSQMRLPLAFRLSHYPR
jgi:hypothetical protein